MKTVEMKSATETIEDYARSARKEPMIFTRHGKPVVALVSMKNTDRETARLSTDPRFMGLIRRIRAHYRVRGGISARQMRERLGHEKR